MFLLISGGVSWVGLFSYTGSGKSLPTDLRLMRSCNSVLYGAVQIEDCCSEAAIHDAPPPRGARARVRHRRVHVRGVWPALPGLLLVEGQPHHQLGRGAPHRLQRGTASAHPGRQGPRRGRLHMPRRELVGGGGGYSDSRGYRNDNGSQLL